MNYEFAQQFSIIYRRARMNVIYYGDRLARTQAADRVIGVTVSVGSSAAVAALAIWRTDIGHAAFATLVGVAVVLQAVRPVLNLSGQISRLSKAWATYSGIYDTLDRLHAELWIHDGRVPAAEAQLLDAMARATGVTAQEDPRPNAKAIRTARAATERAMPVDRLWTPTEDGFSEEGLAAEDAGAEGVEGSEAGTGPVLQPA